MITRQQLLNAIERVELHRFHGTNTIACALVTHHGFVVVGVSHCLEPSEFNATIGAGVARADAESKLAEALAAALRLSPVSQPLAEGANHGH